MSVLFKLKGEKSRQTKIPPKKQLKQKHSEMFTIGFWHPVKRSFEDYLAYGAIFCFQRNVAVIFMTNLKCSSKIRQRGHALYSLFLFGASRNHISRCSQMTKTKTAFLVKWQWPVAQTVRASAFWPTRHLPSAFGSVGSMLVNVRND